MRSRMLRRSLCASSSSLNSMNKNMKLRGILFSIEVLTGMDTSASLEERRRALMKQEEEQKASAAAAAAAATTAPAPTYDTSKEIKGLSSVKSKYMDKIRAKTGGSDGSSSLEGGGVPGGDANMLFKAKKMMASAEANSSSGSNKAVTSASRWLLSAGMGSLLDYASYRTMQLSLFPLPASPKQLTQQLLQQISDTHFVHVARDVDHVSSSSSSNACSKDGQKSADDAELRAKAREEFEEMEKKLGTSFSARQIIVISSDDLLLEIGKSRGYYTCRFRPENALFGKVVCDFVAKDALEIQDALEELNGVAYRNSAFGSRTFR